MSEHEDLMEAWEAPAHMPTLVIEAPTCSHCLNEVTIEDDWAWCEGCRVRWRRIFDGEESEPDPDADGSDVPCMIVPQPRSGHSITVVYGPCILPSGHEGDHETPLRREWSDQENGGDDE